MNLWLEVGCQLLMNPWQVVLGATEDESLSTVNEQKIKKKYCVKKIVYK